MKIENVIEAALFCSEEPLSAQRMKSLFPDDGHQPDAAAIRQAVEKLQEFYQERGIELVEVASGFQFQSTTDFAPFWQRLHEKKPPKASKAYLETLAIIAYKQPATRGDVEQVRGVAVSSHILQSLKDRGWIKSLGFRDVPGKPELWGTTKVFLDAFNLKSLSDMPDLKEVMDFEAQDKKVAAQLEMAITGEEREVVKSEVDEGELLMVDPVAQSQDDTTLDDAYEKAKELFNNCDELLVKANPLQDENEEESVTAEDEIDSLQDDKEESAVEDEIVESSD